MSNNKPAPPSGNDSHPDRQSSNGLPASNTTTAATNWHGAFVPVIVSVVIGTIILATFFDTPSSKSAGLELPVQTSAPASAVMTAGAAAGVHTQTVAARPKASARSNPLAAAAATVAPAAATQATPDTLEDKGASTPHRVADVAGAHAPAALKAPPTPTGMPQGRFAGHPLEARRQAYRQMVQEHNNYLRRLQQHRAAVLRRIERDRRALDLRIREIRRTAWHEQPDFRATAEPPGQIWVNLTHADTR